MRQQQQRTTTTDNLQEEINKYRVSDDVLFVHMLLYVDVGAYPINILSDIISPCAYSSEVIHFLHNSSYRRYLGNNVAQKNDLRDKVARKNDFETKGPRLYITLTCRSNTLKMINNSTAPNAII